MEGIAFNRLEFFKLIALQYLCLLMGSLTGVTGANIDRAELYIFWEVLIPFQLGS